MWHKIIHSKLFFPCMFFSLLIFLTYFPILRNGLFFDDEELIYKNTYVQHLSFFPSYFTTNMIAGAGKVSNMYRPVLITSFALDFFVWGLNPFGFHLTSILLHILNAFFLYFLIRSLFQNKWISYGAAILFSIHPAISEAIIYASGRTDPLYTFFLLLCLIFFLRYIRDSMRNKTYYFISILCFILSLLSKESGIATIFLLPLVFWIETKNVSHHFKKGRLIFIPYIVVACIYVILRLTVLDFQNTLNFYSESNLYASDLPTRIYTFSNSFIQYTRLLFFPNILSVAHNTPLILTPFSPQFIIFLSFFIIAFYFSWTRRDKYPLYLFSFLWFFLTLLPSSGIIPINNITAEHYLYLPSVGFFVFASYTLYLFSSKIHKRYMFLMYGISASICLLLIFRTVLRTQDWKNAITFYSIELQRSSWNVPMHQNLALSYADNGDTEKAIEEYKKTIQLSDTYPNTHHNLGNAYKSQKKFENAEKEYYLALKIDPHFYYSYYALLDLYNQTQNMTKKNEIMVILKQLQLPLP